MKKPDNLNHYGRRYLSVLTLILFLPLTYCFGQGAWSQLNDMPELKNHHASIALDGKIYIFGGGVTTEECTDEVYEYDPVTDTYTSKAPMPTGMCGMAVAELNGKIYLFGGYTEFSSFISDAVFEYDVVNDAWTEMMAMPTARGYATASVMDGKIYVIGGSGTFFVAAKKDVEVFHPTLNEWSTATELPTELGGLTSHAVNGKIFVFGGGTSPVLPATDHVFSYDPEVNDWTAMASMPTARVLHGSSEIDGKIFVLGGLDPALLVPEPAFASIEMYDPELNTWTTDLTPMPTARRVFANSALDGRIYVFGGNTEVNVLITVLKVVEVFDPTLVAITEKINTIFSLAQNFPNPFSNKTSILVTLKKTADVDLSIFDLSGRKVLTFHNESMLPGTYNYWLDADALGTGIYYYRLRAENEFSEVRKMVVIK